VRREGLKAARFLEEEYGIPYVYGRPYGLAGTMKWLQDIGQKAGWRAEEGYLREQSAKLRRHIMSYQLLLRETADKKTVLTGDYDVVVGLAFLTEELGLQLEKMAVAHQLGKKDLEQVPEKWRTLLWQRPEEEAWLQYLGETPLYLLIADGVSQKHGRQSRLQLQIANPNLYKYNIYPHTPYTGFNGVLYLLQCLTEQERKKIAE
jgi:nitrogenase molybdenum-cofactor synthesis protein NifE